LFGGELFEEEIFMWWNFVVCFYEEIVEVWEIWMVELVVGFVGDGLWFVGVFGFDGLLLFVFEFLMFWLCLCGCC